MKYLIVICSSGESELEIQKQQCKTLCRICADKGAAAEIRIFHYQKGQMAASVIAESLVKSAGYHGILITECEIGIELSGLLAAKLHYQCINSVNKICSEDKGLIVYKAVYNCNMEAQYLLKESFVVSFKGLKSETEDRYVETEEKLTEYHLSVDKSPCWILERGLKKMYAHQEGSGLLIAVGQGIHSREDVKRIRTFAQENGYMFGVSRPVAMNGWAGINEIIGVSGHIYSPEICIAIGVSGSAAFYAGIENSKWIASVNIDKKAPIVKMSDAVIIADYRDIWENLKNLIKNGGTI